MDTLIRYRKEIRLKGTPYVTKDYLYLSPYVPVLEFKEGEDVSFTFLFNPDICRVFYEDRLGQKVEIHSEEKIQFSKPLENGYAVGNYPFEVFYRDKLYSFFFQVKPSQMDVSTVQTMRMVVNRFCKGASLNTYASQSEKEGEVDRSAALLEILPSVSQMCHLYMEKGYSEASKKQKVSRTSKKVSKSSMEWLAKKGMGVHGSLDSLLVEKTYFEQDNDQNRLFKEQVQFWNDELSKQIQNLRNYNKEMQSDIDLKNEVLEGITQKEVTLGQEVYLSEYALRKEKKQLQYVSKDMKKKEVRLEKDQRLLQELLRYKSIFEKMLMHSWLTNVHVNSYAHTRPKLDSLRVLVELKRKYETSLKETKVRKIDQEKSTFELFETYTYVLLIELMKDLGFHLLDTGNLLYRLNNESRMLLQRKDLYCQIQYDVELKKSRDVKQNEYCTINSKHNRPDFLISFYKEGESPFLTLIVENKWTSGSHIYNQKTETEVEETLSDYYQLAYKDHTLHRGIVNQVLCVFPDTREEVIEMGDDMFALGIHPGKTKHQSMGYANLKAHVLNELKSTI